MSTEEENIWPKLANEVNTIRLNAKLPFDKIEQFAPTLANEIARAMDNANDASSLDKSAPLPNKVIIYDNLGEYAEDKNQDASVLRNAKGDYTLFLEKAYLDNAKLSGFRATLEHEFTHVIQAETQIGEHELSFKSNAASQRSEFMADRGATNSIDFVVDFLESTRNDSSNNKDSANRYSRNSENYEHPNNRERIGSLLEEAYFNHVSKNAGEISAEDGKFHPFMDKAGFPITEDGQRITNYREIEAAANQQVKADLKLLDSLVANGLSKEDIGHFILHIERTETEFKKNNIPHIENASNTTQSNASTNANPELNKHFANEITPTDGKLLRLANSFLHDDLKDESIKRQNIAEEPRMAFAYAGLELCKREIERDASGRKMKNNPDNDDPELALSILQARISEGIKHNVFPKLQLQEATNKVETAYER